MARPKKYQSTDEYKDKHNDEYARITVSREVQEKLIHIKESKGLSSYDDVLRLFLSFYLDKN